VLTGANDKASLEEMRKRREEDRAAREGRVAVARKYMHNRRGAGSRIEEF
jgi:hypothetical protein